MPRGDKSNTLTSRNGRPITSQKVTRTVVWPRRRLKDARGPRSTKMMRGGKRPGGSGRGKRTGNPAAHKGGRKGGAASASRSRANRSASASAKKAAATRKRNA